MTTRCPGTASRAPPPIVRFTARPGESAPVREDDCLDPAAQVELGRDR
jgi:hypothetical protein